MEIKCKFIPCRNLLGTEWISRGLRNNLMYANRYLRRGEAQKINIRRIRRCVRERVLSGVAFYGLLD